MVILRDNLFLRCTTGLICANARSRKLTVGQQNLASAVYQTGSANASSDDIRSSGPWFYKTQPVGQSGPGFYALFDLR